MDIRFNCYLSYLVIVYLLGLSVAIIISAYTFYTYGRDDCYYSLELYRQSISAIFGGIGTCLLLISLLMIPDNIPAPISDSNGNMGNDEIITTRYTTKKKSYARSIIVFTILFIISSLLTTLEVYLFVSNHLYTWAHNDLGQCNRIYYEATYSTTILSVIPVFIIAFGIIGLIIGNISNCLNRVCCQPSNKGYYRILKQTNRDTQTTPVFINPENYGQKNKKNKYGITISNSSDDDALSLDGTDFTFDAPELQLTRVITTQAKP